MNLVKLTKSIGLKPKPEIGILFGAGGDTEGLESIGTRDPKWLIEVGGEVLGVPVVIVGKEGSFQKRRLGRLLTDYMALLRRYQRELMRS